jgi:hypothetical protein
MSAKKNTPRARQSSTTAALPISRFKTRNARTKIQATKAGATKHVLALHNNEQPPEEEARLDAHDELRTEADVIFDLMNGEGLPDEFQSNIREVIADLLCTTKVDVFSELSLWREAWKLVSERTAAQDRLERGIE